MGVGMDYWQDDPVYEYPVQNYVLPYAPYTPHLTDLQSFDPEGVLPWWPERTNNQYVVKPLRGGLEVHDLVMTFNSDNVYAKQTYIDFIDYYLNTCSHNYGDEYSRILDMWIDPFTVMRLHFLTSVFPYFQPTYGITYTAGIAGSYLGDANGGFQYAFESVPFYNSNFQFPLSQFYKTPHPQPTLPIYENWPGNPDLGAVTFGTNATVATGTLGTCHFYSTGSNPTTPDDDIYVFDVPDAAWPFNAYAGFWLIDQYNAKFRIAGNTATQLFLLRAGTDVEYRISDTPPTYETRHVPGVADGPWAI
ncbi:MAG TPA: hypothetical protein PLI07_14720, partial [Candidatus Hydrogenedentes bacterium]|nr:hypothetical protein [Candidatus Hydrogenedentota bacterium]